MESSPAAADSVEHENVASEASGYIQGEIERQWEVVWCSVIIRSSDNKMCCVQFITFHLWDFL